ncbi:MAG: hypothetical protein JO001_07415 [Alphaproteobacteria bacterium]|nr:hypothetical protein [Alphaproteobacteria bacterium]
MSIETDFKFGHVVAAPAGVAPPPDPRGLLAGFVGNLPLALPGQDNPKRSWSGQGFNLIWRPNFGGQSGSKDFFLELNLTQETLDFTDITGAQPNVGIANRGALQKDILLGGIAYLQQVTDSISGVGQHFEPGVWINVPSTTNPAAPGSVVRMGSIPHGTTINLEGVVFTAPSPLIANTTITPFQVGSPDDGTTGLVHFPEEVLTNVTTSRTPPASVHGLTQAVLTNPNLLLQNVIAGQSIIETTVLIIASDPTLMPPPGGPLPAHATAGGGIASIEFLSGGVSTGFNANVLATTAIFWIETVKNPDGTTFLQLQYTQRVLLVFNGLVWPHISVATLT